MPELPPRASASARARSAPPRGGRCVALVHHDRARPAALGVPRGTPAISRSIRSRLPGSREPGLVRPGRPVDPHSPAPAPGMPVAQVGSRSAVEVGPVEVVEVGGGVDVAARRAGDPQLEVGHREQQLGRAVRRRDGQRPRAPMPCGRPRAAGWPSRRRRSPPRRRPPGVRCAGPPRAVRGRARHTACRRRRRPRAAVRTRSTPAATPASGPPPGGSSRVQVTGRPQSRGGPTTTTGQLARQRADHGLEHGRPVQAGAELVGAEPPGGTAGEHDDGDVAVASRWSLGCRRSSHQCGGQGELAGPGARERRQPQAVRGCGRRPRGRRPPGRGAPGRPPRGGGGPHRAAGRCAAAPWRPTRPGARASVSTAARSRAGRAARRPAHRARRPRVLLGGVAGGQPGAPGLPDGPGVGAGVTVALGEPLGERRRQRDVLLGAADPPGPGPGGHGPARVRAYRAAGRPRPPAGGAVLLGHQPGTDEHAQVVARGVGVPTDRGDEVARRVGGCRRRAPGDDLQQPPA